MNVIALALLSTALALTLWFMALALDCVALLTSLMHLYQSHKTLYSGNGAMDWSSTLISKPNHHYLLLKLKFKLQATNS